MFEWFINYATIIAFFALTIDLILQIIHIYKRKSSKDLSLKGCLIRLIAGLILLIKFIATNDIYLTIGQGVFVFSYIIYFIMLIYYRK